MALRLVIGIILTVWWLIELYAGSVWFITKFGIARYTEEDDGFLFYAIAWGKIIGGVIQACEYFSLY